MDWDFWLLVIGWFFWFLALLTVMFTISSLLFIVYKIGIKPWMERKIAKAEAETMPKVGDGEDEKGSTPRSGT